MATHCEQCADALSNHKNRFCTKCASEMRRVMKRSGYLQNTYVAPYFREDRGRKGMRDPRVLGGVPW